MRRASVGLDRPGGARLVDARLACVRGLAASIRPRDAERPRSCRSCGATVRASRAGHGCQLAVSDRPSSGRRVSSDVCLSTSPWSHATSVPADLGRRRSSADRRMLEPSGRVGDARSSRTFRLATRRGAARSTIRHRRTTVTTSTPIGANVDRVVGFARRGSRRPADCRRARRRERRPAPWADVAVARRPTVRPHAEARSRSRTATASRRFYQMLTRGSGSTTRADCFQRLRTRRSSLPRRSAAA